MARELCEVQGLIFKRKKYKEADVLTKIMTEDHGIFTIDVRGALRPKYCKYKLEGNQYAADFQGCKAAGPVIFRFN